MVENNDVPVVVQIPIARQGRTTFMHAVVVVGLDNEGSDIVVMDPDPNGSPGLQSVPRTVFLQTWATTDFTAFYFEP